MQTVVQLKSKVVVVVFFVVVLSHCYSCGYVNNENIVKLKIENCLLTSYYEIRNNEFYFWQAHLKCDSFDEGNLVSDAGIYL